MPTLHVHLDESGDLNFSPRGTRYYVFTVAWTYEPATLAAAVTRLRFSLLKQGHNVHCFHATEDRQVNRNAVVALLGQHDAWQFAAVVIEKRKVYPDLRSPQRFYPHFAASAFKYVFHRYVQQDTATVVVFTDQLPLNKHRRAVEKTIKTVCRNELATAIAFQSYHHASASNAWLQIVDYCSWAVFKKWERGDERTYEQIRHRLAEPELDALRHGNIVHY